MQLNPPTCDPYHLVYQNLVSVWASQKEAFRFSQGRILSAKKIIIPQPDFIYFPFFCCQKLIFEEDFRPYHPKTSWNGIWPCFRIFSCVASTPYCSWLKSCTSWKVVYPTIYRVLYIQGGAGFQPSKVSLPTNFFNLHSKVTPSRNSTQQHAPYGWRYNQRSCQIPPLFCASLNPFFRWIFSFML